MKMTEQQHEYVRRLKLGEPMPADYIEGYYGLKWPFEGKLLEFYTKWGSQWKKDFTKAIPIYLETFFRDQKRSPEKWIAAELGMTEPSLSEVLKNLDKLALVKEDYTAFPHLLKNSFADDLWNALPGLKYKQTLNPRLRCERLHQALEDTLHIKVEPWWCETSRQLGEPKLEYARYIDCLTFEPVSIKHQMWLTFRPKLMTLGPDYVSKLFYVQNQDELKEFAPFAQDEKLDLYSPQLVGSQ